jgi:ribonuclease HI
MSSYYAVAVGLKPGIYNTWNECKANIENVKNAVYKKFDNQNDAQLFIDEYKNSLYVYTDGACTNNGNENARAGIGIYFSKDNPLNVSKELKIPDVKLTNNIAELIACIEAIRIIKNEPHEKKIIVTDSEYVIKCATTYGKKLESNNWLTKQKNLPPPNVELVKKLYELTNKYKITYKHVEAHTNKKDKHSIGNYYADLFANSAIKDEKELREPKEPKEEEKEKRIYLKVPYEKKEIAKGKGARWNPEMKKWYILESNKNKKELLELFT